MPAHRRRAQRGRPRHAAPKALPDDLYDYGDDPAPRSTPRRGGASDAFDAERLPVIDDWPEHVPVTVAEIDIFERYFGDVLDRLFAQANMPRAALKALSQSDNKTYE